MTYLLLVVVFVGVAALVLVLARRRAHAAGDAGPGLAAIGWSFAVLAVLTAVFDNLMIAADLFGYDEEHLVDLWIGRAPVEDLGYPAAVVLLMPALWHLLGRRRPSRAPTGADAGEVR